MVNSLHIVAESSRKDFAPDAPAVVLSTKGVNLADKLKLSELPLATTPGGKAFTYEALHPSSHEYSTTRVPGGNIKSVALRCEMIQELPIADDGTEVDIHVIPNPLVPACMGTVPPAGASTQPMYANFYNAAFGGSFTVGPTTAHTGAVMGNFLSTVQNYRITAQCVTAEIIASALTDQGSVVGYQADLPPMTVQPAIIDPATTVAVRTDVHVHYPPPNISQGLLGTVAYTSKAKDGIYMPLKLTDFEWKTASDRCVAITGTAAGQSSVTCLTENRGCAEPMLWPYFENRTGFTNFGNLVAIPKSCGYNVGIIRFAGLLKGATVRVRVRQVVEINARPGTTFAPLLEMPLPPDEVALRMYQEVSGRMQDGYPASYNDLGRLKNVIMGLAKKVLPYVEPALDLLANSGLPVVGTGATIAKHVVGAGKLLANAAGGKKKVQSKK